MNGKISFKNPDKIFWLMERHIDSSLVREKKLQEKALIEIFFGVEVARAKSSARISQKKNYLLQFDLRNRAYLGPTSTDHMLSFLMTN